jgi:hypothetical protein
MRLVTAHLETRPLRICSKLGDSGTMPQQNDETFATPGSLAKEGPELATPGRLAVDMHRQADSVSVASCRLETAGKYQNRARCNIPYAVADDRGRVPVPPSMCPGDPMMGNRACQVLHLRVVVPLQAPPNASHTIG